MKRLLRCRWLIVLIAAVACLLSACSGSTPDDTPIGATATQSTPQAWNQAEADRVETALKAQPDTVWASYLRGGSPLVPSDTTIDIDQATFRVQPDGVRATVSATITEANSVQVVMLHLLADGSKWAVVSMQGGEKS